MSSLVAVVSRLPEVDAFRAGCNVVLQLVCRRLFPRLGEPPWWFALDGRWLFWVIRWSRWFIGLVVVPFGLIEGVSDVSVLCHRVGGSCEW